MAGAKVELATAYLTMIPSLRGANESLRRELNPAMAAGIGAGIGTVLASGISRGVSAVATVIPDAIAAGGQLEQSIGAIDTVFKGSSGQMHAWAEQAANDVGLTKDEFNNLGVLIGSQLKNGGTAMDEIAPKTNELIGLGADLSSMFGGSTSEAVAALSSALKGERDPIERYGISLSQAKIDAEAAALGFEKVGGALSAEAQQAATMSLIMKQSGDARGNFAKESDTIAGKQQRLTAAWGNASATLGTALLPVMGAVLPVIQGIANQAGILAPIIGSALTDGFRNTGAAVSGVIGFFTEFQGVGIGLAAAIGFVVVATAAHALVTGIQSGALVGYLANLGIVRGATAAWAAVQWVLNGALSANPIGIVVVVLAALVAGVIWAYNNVGWFKDGVNNAWRTISGVTMGVLGAVGGWFRGLWGGIVAFGRGAVAGFVGFVTGAWNNVRSFTIGALGAAGSFFRSIWTGAISFGRGVIVGFVGFVTGSWNNIRNTTSAIIGGAASFLRNLLSGAVGTARGIVGGFVGFIGGSWNNILGTTRGVFSGVSSFINGIWGGIRAGASGAVNGVIGFFSGIPGRIRGAIGNAWGLLSGIGGQIMEGFLSGLRSSWGAVTDFVGGIAGWIRDNKGPESKDRVLLRPHGNWILGGLARSLQENIGLLEPPLTAVTDRIAGQAYALAAPQGRGVRGAYVGGPGGPGVQRDVKIDVHTNDPETAAELTARKLRRAGA